MLRIKCSDGDVGTMRPCRIISPVGLGHYRMRVWDRKGAEARSGLEVTVSHAFFLFNCSMVAAPTTSWSIIDQAR